MLKRIASILSTCDTGRVTPKAREDRLAVAASVLLLEMAGADDFFSPTESARIRDMLRNGLGVPPEEIESVLAIAERAREDSADLWTYTNLINEGFTAAEKLRLVEMIWEIAYADGSLDQNEDYLIHKLANLLHVKHQDLIAAKIRVKERGRVR